MLPTQAVDRFKTHNWQEIKAACRTLEILSDPGQTSRGLGVVYV
jgi:hypothetical protein